MRLFRVFAALALCALPTWARADNAKPAVEFRELSDDKAALTLPGSDDKTVYHLAPTALFTIDDIAYAEMTPELSGHAAIYLVLKKAQASRFADFTGSHVGKPLAIVLDGKVLSAPRIMVRIPNGRILLSTGKSVEDGQALIDRINAYTKTTKAPAPAK